mmetsp:Transcript_10339/g.29085  ORF Transcript_10339/g.29085 Transcript_10339/m.29085 type:complete len:114 (+) Transcript_10339:1531-1872(+)
MTIVVLSWLAMSTSNASWTTCSESVSKALVASSSKRIFGFFTRARAIAIRCFWPPLSCVPLSPTSVLYPSGKAEIKSWQLAALDASMMSDCFARSQPMPMFLNMLPLKRTGSC